MNSLYNTLEQQLRIASDSNDLDQINLVLADIEQALEDGKIDKLDRCQLIDILQDC